MKFLQRNARLPIWPAAIAAIAVTSQTFAASGLWKGNSSVNFNDAANWFTTDNAGPLGSVPGGTGTTTSPDNLSFSGNTSSSATSITVDANRNILGLNATSGGPGATFSGGSFIFSNAGNVGTTGGSKTYTFNTPISFVGNYTFSPAATTVFNLNGALTFSAVNGLGVQTLSLQGASSALSTVSQVISNGAGTGNSTAVSKGGSGVWALTAANTYTGGTTLSGGTLALGNDAALGAGSFTFGGASTIRSTDATDRTINNALATFTGSSGVTYTFGATSGGTGGLNFSNTASVGIGTPTRTFAVNNTTSFASPLTGTGSVAKTLNGVLQFNGNNAYTGTTTVNAGSLLIEGVTTGQGNYSVAVTATTASAPLLGGGGSIGLASGRSLTITGGVGAGSIPFNAIVNPGTDAGAPDTLTVGSGATNNVIFGDQSLLAIDLAGNLADVLAINGNLDLSGTGDQLVVNATGTQTEARYVIATYTGTLSGSFGANVTLNGLPGGSIDYSVPNEIAVVVPEPTTLAGLGLAGAGLLARRGRSRTVNR